ncbi:unnamed protein product [Ectocarpus sp. 13 AM-2016]
MAPIMAAVVFLAAMTAANGFIAPLAGRHNAPLARSYSTAALQMSTEGGDDKPFVFPRSMLKKGKLEIPNFMGVGTMAWGDKKVGFVSDPKYKPKEGEFNPADLQGAYNTLMDAGITFFDTSDVYGYKSSPEGFSAEQLLGTFAEENVRQCSNALTPP